jgi:hypothetical protein
MIRCNIFGMAKFDEGDPVRNVKTKYCGVVKRSFVREGHVWYEVLSMETDTREEWQESDVVEEKVVNY